jgi:hypothetical protein
LLYEVDVIRKVFSSQYYSLFMYSPNCVYIIYCLCLYLGVCQLGRGLPSSSYIHCGANKGATFLEERHQWRVEVHYTVSSLTRFFPSPNSRDPICDRSRFSVQGGPPDLGASRLRNCIRRASKRRDGRPVATRYGRFELECGGVVGQ